VVANIDPLSITLPATVGRLVPAKEAASAWWQEGIDVPDAVASDHAHLWVANDGNSVTERLDECPREGDRRLGVRIPAEVRPPIECLRSGAVLAQDHSQLAPLTACRHDAGRRARWSSQHGRIKAGAS
jgi:hypothetical protein